MLLCFIYFDGAEIKDATTTILLNYHRNRLFLYFFEYRFPTLATARPGCSDENLVIGFGPPPL